MIPCVCLTPDSRLSALDFDSRFLTLTLTLDFDSGLWSFDSQLRPLVPAGRNERPTFAARGHKMTCEQEVAVFGLE